MNGHALCEVCLERQEMSQNGTRLRTIARHEGVWDFLHGIQMIVGKCSNPPAGYGAAEQRRDSAAPDGPGADNDVAGGREVAIQGRFRPRTAARWSRLDAPFVTQLIATAEQVPQTRVLRRASVADAMSYYNAVTKAASSGHRVMTRGLSRVV